MLNVLGGLSLGLFLSLLRQDAAAQEEKMRVIFDALVKAMAEKDAEAINRCFHAPRMMKEMEARGFGAPSATPEDLEKKSLALKAALPKLAAGASATGSEWEKIRILTVQHAAGADEAEALCRVSMGGGKTKVRFWLARDGDWWKIYDFEMQEANFRLSILMGGLWASMAGDAEQRRTVMKGFVAFQKAAVQLASGDAEEARMTLQAALAAKPPAMLAGWLELLNAEACLLLGEGEEAVKAADRALAAQKDLHIGHHVKAAALFDLEKYEACIEAELLYLKAAGDDAEGWIVVGNAHDMLKQPAQAIEAYRKGAASDDEDFDNRLQLGRLLIAEKKVAEARAPLREASKNAPEDSDVFEQAAELLDGAGDFAGVQELAAERLKRTPDDPSVLCWNGKSLRRLKKFDEAEKALRAALEMNKEHGDLTEELIFTLAEAGKDREALAADDLLDGSNLRGWFRRAFIHAAASRTEKAVEELRGMFDIDPSQVESIEKEPGFARLLKDPGMQKVLAAAHATNAFLEEAEAKREKEDWDGLLKLTRDRVNGVSEDKRGHYYQGLAHRRLGNFLDAELALKSAITRTKDKREFRDELGRALASQGKLEEALAVARELTAEGYTDTAQLLRVAAHVLAKKLDPAQLALAELLEKFPDSVYEVEGDADLAEFLKLPACQALLKKAKQDE